MIDLLVEQTTLYRAFDGAGRLLYVGIAARWPSRWSQHARDSVFFSEVSRLELTSYPTRDEALEGERRAILQESPAFNVVHNSKTARRRAGIDPAQPEPPARLRRPGDRRWSFASRKTGVEFIDRLWLYPELNCSSCIDDHWSDDGESQLDYYLRYLRLNYPDWLESDAVSVSWFVVGDRTIEAAPYQPHWYRQEQFLSFYTWPHDVQTEEPLDWFRLPVINSRFPEFAKALGWQPAPMQSHAPLASIMGSKSCIRPVGNGCPS